MRSRKVRACCDDHIEVVGLEIGFSYKHAGIQIAFESRVAGMGVDIDMAEVLTNITMVSVRKGQVVKIQW